MAWPTSTFPTAIDVITDKADSTDYPVANDINGAYDCIEKIEAKVGANSSVVATSLDYLLKNTSSVSPGHKHVLAEATNGLVTASVAELNLLDDTVAGTAVASRVLALGTDKNVDMLAIAQDGLKIGAGAGTAMTCTAAELNFNDGSSVGVAVASKTLVLGANKNVDTLVIAQDGLKIGAVGGTAVTATAAELNILDGVNATASEINTACDLTVNGFFAAGTKVWFYQATAPVGWTISDPTAEALLAVAKAGGTYTTGGSQQGHWLIDVAEIPAHTHSSSGAHAHTTPLADGGGGAALGWCANDTWIYGYYTTGYNAATTSVAHEHTSVGGGLATYRPLASVGIICSKD
jgi:hypothetical protein